MGMGIATSHGGMRARGEVSSSHQSVCVLGEGGGERRAGAGLRCLRLQGARACAGRGGGDRRAPATGCNGRSGKPLTAEAY
eukprot:354526-Chlamydomonas_euryale.AAC.8